MAGDVYAHYLLARLIQMLTAFMSDSKTGKVPELDEIAPWLERSDFFQGATRAKERDDSEELFESSIQGYLVDG